MASESMLSFPESVLLRDLSIWLSLSKGVVQVPEIIGE